MTEGRHRGLPSVKRRLVHACSRARITRPLSVTCGASRVTSRCSGDFDGDGKTDIAVLSSVEQQLGRLALDHELRDGHQSPIWHEGEPRSSDRASIDHLGPFRFSGSRQPRHVAAGGGLSDTAEHMVPGNPG